MIRLLFVLVTVSLFGFESHLAAQNFWPQNPSPQLPVYSGGQNWPAQPNRYQQPRQSDALGKTTIVLPDGRIITRVPFSEEQKRQIAEREASRTRLKTVRERELDQQGKNDSLYPRLPAEFEKQKAIMLSLADWQPHNLSVLVELIEKTRGRVNLLILHNEKNPDDEKSQIDDLLALLARSGKDYPHLRFLNVNLNTIWLRDFGPMFAQTEFGGATVVDFFYDTNRPLDDDLPKLWAEVTNARHHDVPWFLQGGNLISNGQGLSIATRRIFEENRCLQDNQFFWAGNTVEEDEEHVRQRIMKFCNIKELVVLKPLEQEQTRHADMFATFLAPDLVLVAKIDSQLDPVNAGILNFNAEVLAKANVDGRPLRVERVWIPPRRGEHWSAFTNIILTDRLVLIPTYHHDPPQYVQSAVQTYQRLLPHHHVATVDMTLMDKLGGSLHCLSCPIPFFAELPKGLLSFKQASAPANRLPASTD